MDKFSVILLLGLIAVPIAYSAYAVDFTITRQAGDTSNALLIENNAGTDQFWVDVNGYVYANGTQIRINTLTCTGTDKFSAWDNSTGLFTCSADDSAGAPASIHLIGNVTSVGCIENHVIKVDRPGFYGCAVDNSFAGAMVSLTDVTNTGCAENLILEVSGSAWACIARGENNTASNI